MDEIRLSREVPATVVPYGDAITLPEGTAVTITHRLGGHYTILWEQGMARIDGAHADALGETPVVRATSAASDLDGPPDEKVLWDALRLVFDPEIPVNIVDLGLVYDLSPKPAPDGDGTVVEVRMTLTAPGCGMGPSIAADARSRLEAVPGVSSANVELVWDPPWSQEMISEEGKMQLGLI